MTVTTVYSGTGDGTNYYVSTTYATAAGGGGTPTSDAASAGNNFIGQLLSGADYYIMQTGCGWDTSAIDDGDTVSDAIVSLWGGADQSATDFTINCYDYDWSGGGWTIADFRSDTQLNGMTVRATFATAGFTNGGYNTFTSSGAGLAPVINKTGTTYLLFASSRQASLTAPTGAEYVFVAHAETAGTTNDPKLVVTHAAAGGVTGNTLYSKTLRSLTQGRVMN